MESRPSKRYFLALFLVYFAITGCRLPSTSGAFPINVRSTRVTLEWDPPNPQFPAPALLIANYRVYYRPHGADPWQFLCIVPATGSPRLELDHSDFGNGSYDFAVGCVSQAGGESNLHSSLDASADPYGGWYLDWITE